MSCAYINKTKALQFFGPCALIGVIYLVPTSLRSSAGAGAPWGPVALALKMEKSFDFQVISRPEITSRLAPSTVYLRGGGR
jgi:hypothetical protein